jgi:uncharacterized protein (DUF697 family)
MKTPDPRSNAEKHVRNFTLAAMATGAIPVPATSLAIVAENVALLSAVAAEYGLQVSLGTIIASMGPATAANAVGRAVFVEAARVMGWFAGPFGVAGVSTLGAATASLQTWVFGQVAIAVCENGGIELAERVRRGVIESARSGFEGFRKEPRATRPASTRSN